jgi:hypothetical protein
MPGSEVQITQEKLKVHHLHYWREKQHGQQLECASHPTWIDIVKQMPGSEVKVTQQELEVHYLHFLAGNNSSSSNIHELVIRHYRGSLNQMYMPR